MQTTLIRGHNPPVMARSNAGDPFFVLGDPRVAAERTTAERIRDRSRVVPREVWATLGAMPDDDYNRNDGARPALDAERWRGVVAHSSEGHLLADTDASATARGEAVLIEGLFDRVTASNAVERTLLVRSLELGDDRAGLSRLRFDLFLDRTEGAEVYLDWGDGPDPTIQYVQPYATDDNHSYERTRLTYSIPIPNNPAHRPEALRALTFRRPGRRPDSHSLLDSIASKTGLAVQPQLLRYDAQAHDMRPVQSAVREVDPSLPTLLLLHGTFASTAVSFEELLASRRPWIELLLSRNDGRYEQILAFDHPTILADAATNSADLRAQLDAVPFQHPIDLLTSSRGGLVGQYLANQPTTTMPFHVGRCALVCCANGVHWFEAGHRVAGFLTVLRRILKRSGGAPAWLSAVAFFAQQSAKFFLARPGCRQMTPGESILTDILDGTPMSPHTDYYPVCADYDPRLRNDEHSLLRALSLRVLDGIVDRILPKHNDMVVATQNEFTFPADRVTAISGYRPQRFGEFAINANHLDILEETEARDRIARYLMG